VSKIKPKKRKAELVAAGPEEVADTSDDTNEELGLEEA
jgi:hypothetical protein